MVWMDIIPIGECEIKQMSGRPRNRAKPLFLKTESELKDMYEANLDLYLTMKKEREFTPTDVLKKRIRTLVLEQQRIDLMLNQIWEIKK